MTLDGGGAESAPLFLHMSKAVLEAIAGVTIGYIAFSIGDAYYSPSREDKKPNAANQLPLRNISTPDQLSERNIFERFDRLKNSTHGFGRAFFSKNEILSQVRALLEEFVDWFRKDPAAALKGLNELSEPERTDALRMIFGDPGPDVRVAVLNIKYSYLPKGLLSNAPQDVKMSIFGNLVESDPSAVSQILRGELGTKEEQEIAKALNIFPSHSPDWWPDSKGVSLALVQTLTRQNVANLADKDLRNFKSAVTWLTADQMVAVSQQIEPSKQADFWRSEAGAVLARQLLKTSPNSAIQLAAKLPRDSAALNALAKEFSQSGDFETLQRIFGQEISKEQQALLDEAHLNRALSSARQGHATDLGAVVGDYLASVPEEVQSKKFQEIAESILREPSDPGSLLESLAHVGTESTNQLAAALVDQWANDDAVGVSKVLVSAIQNGGIDDSVIVPFIKKIHDDPEAVIMWASMLQNHPEKQQMISTALEGLKSSDPQQAALIENSLQP